MKTDVDKLLGDKSAFWKAFNQRAKNKKIKSIDGGYLEDGQRKVEYKQYPRLNRIILPKPSLSENVTLLASLTKRKSTREFSKDKVSLKKISNLLFFSAGLNDQRDGLRFYPSAGAKFPLEIYLISLNTEIVRGLYHYSAKGHVLEELLTFRSFDVSAYFNQDWVGDAAFIILISAVFDRNISKYKDRGYKYILMEAGHLGQNFYINSAALNLGCCAVGGFVDDELDELLDLRYTGESVIYSLAFGEHR